MHYVLKSTNARAARREAQSLPGYADVHLTGFDKKRNTVYLSLVRRETRGNVATAFRNMGFGLAIRFEADVDY